MIADTLFDLTAEQDPAEAERRMHAHIDVLLDIVDWIDPADLDTACAEACTEMGIPVHPDVAARIAKRQDEEPS
ncbi:hypothetical protein [Streptomyces sp. NPDC048392]|uniref:hypothetical protein n=1 Tax=Streptomyces sp. NPDC048392 TaxID=3365543 RepID=UPI003711F0C8